MKVDSRDMFCVAFQGNKLLNKAGFLGTSDPFLVISRMNEDETYTVVWKSNKIDNTLNPKWSYTKILLSTLCNNDLLRPIRIEVFDFHSSGNHISMGGINIYSYDNLLLINWMDNYTDKCGFNDIFSYIFD